MGTKKIILAISIFLFFGLNIAIGQAFYKPSLINIDSLENLLPTSEGLKRINILHQASEYYRLNDINKCVQYAEQAYMIAEELKNQEALRTSSFHLGIAYFHQGEYPKAIRYALDAFENIENISDPLEILKKGEPLVMIYLYSGNEDLAVEFALNLYQRLQHFPVHPLMLFAMEIRMGWVYLKAEQYNEAIPHFKKNVILTDSLNIVPPGNIAINAVHLGDCYLKEKKHDSAFIFLSQAYEISKEHGFQTSDPNDDMFGYMALYYYEIGVSDSAKVFYQKALNEHTLNEYMIGIALSNIQLGKLAEQTGGIEEALNYYKTSIKNAKWVVENKKFFKTREKQIKSWYIPLQDVSDYVVDKGLEVLIKAHFLTAEAYKELKSYRSSSDHLEECIRLNKQLEELNTKREVMELNTRYEMERNQQRIVLLEKNHELAQNKVQQTRLILFGISSFLLVILLIVLLYLRQNRLRSEQERLKLRQKLFRSQMNPHFLYNSLASIQKYIVTEDSDKASIYLSNFSKLIRNILESSIDEYAPLEKEIHTIDYYLELQKTRFEDKFDYTIEIDSRLDSENMEIPAMLAQPFIENAIEHGIKYKKEKGNISIRFKRDKNYLKLEIEDDGVGRAKAQEILSLKNKDHKSVGMSLTEERIKLLNRNRKQNIALEIIDLNEAKAAMGTLVILHIPLC